MTRAKHSRSHRRRTRRESLTALAMLAPALVLFAVFVFYPLGRTVYLGLHRQSLFGAMRYVGWSQYTDVLKSADFHHSLFVTFVFALLTVPGGLAAGLGLAVLANKKLRGITFYRTLFSSTVATSVAVTSLIWLVLLNPSIGVLPKTFSGLEILQTPGLLGRSNTALLAVSISTLWQNLGFTFILMTAGLQSIPEDLYESARVDGATPWRQFSNITVPMLGPTLMFGFVVLTIGAFQSFGQIDLLTQGGPGNSTRVIVYDIYQKAFGTSPNPGVAAAEAVLLFLIVVVLSIVQFRWLDKRVHYGS
ncbi:MAG: carbohydrate ABC transporter permease [Acidimicrobiia bacterium]